MVEGVVANWAIRRSEFWLFSGYQFLFKLKGKAGGSIENFRLVDAYIRTQLLIKAV